MKAIDTNVLVRYIVADQPDQTRTAEQVISAGVAIPLTVLLETGWVLQSRYGFDRARLSDTVDRLFDVHSIRIENEASARQSIAVFRSGADWADAIHLAASIAYGTFVTFDRKLAKATKTPIPIELAQLSKRAPSA